MKKILAITTLSFFLFSCSEEVINIQVAKKDFFIETKTISDFNNDVNLEKTGKISSSQMVKISSNAMGRVKKIYKKEGDSVKKGDWLVVLDDSISNYGLNVAKAQNALDRAEINYDSTKITLDKQVFDTQLNVEKLEKNLKALKDNTSEDLRKAESDLTNADYKNIESKSSLDLEKMDNSIEKAKLDYNNKIIVDKNSVNSYYNSLKKEYSSFSLSINDIIQFSDELLGVTDLNRNKNDSFENYLGAKDTNLKSESEQKLLSLINYKNNILTNIDINSNTGFVDSVNKINDGYKLTKELLDLLEDTLNNSVASSGNFSETTISTYIASVNAYQSSVQSKYSLFLAFENSSISFFNTFKKLEESALKSIDLLEKDREIFKKSLVIGGDNAEVGYNKTVISTSDSIDNLEIQLKSAKNSLENAIKTKEVTLRSLKNSINEANLALSQANKEYSKLTIKSPINGVVGSIFIDKGQEVGNGNPIISISNNYDNEVVVSFNKAELNNVNVGDIAYIDLNNTTFTGSIYSISSVADSNLNYVSKISFNKGMDIIGDVVKVRIPFKLNNNTLPLNIIKVDNSGNGVINVFTGGTIEKETIKIGAIYGDKTEVLDNINPDLKIITSDISNFDEGKFELKIK